ncbi:retron system putative HNH endonuclease [Corynebacterium liangguodongii]|uniref:TIGR02646 family protein n=1 Tax=Corynebacterium liangguodongii TaxID=2079535 RepID=A0A2S0WG03_9CORY|nr:retron system putative HNH endonuclease [Corynebacterium liangguodongii]AWB84707.1 TIGR02646 family protein [Corynebacterium liangguodongii]PWB99715.1 TIGR02646 family protein [Corynebacterium liangguodongii]
MGEVARAQRAEIRSALEEMSKGGPDHLCNYCESRIGDQCHIEHLTPRSKNGKLTYSWANLFLSCNSTQHCGHYKDRAGNRGYTPADLIHPDLEDPDDFLQFSSDGKVHPRDDVSADAQRRAKETIKVLNLNCKKLVGARQNAVRSLRQQSLDDLDELEKWSVEERAEYFGIDSFENYEYPTAMRHFCTSLR